MHCYTECEHGEKSEHTWCDLHQVAGEHYTCEEDHTGEWTIATKATCTTDGKRTRTCTVCGAIEYETIEAYGEHNFTSTRSCSVCDMVVFYIGNVEYMVEEGTYWEDWIPTQSTYTIGGSVGDAVVNENLNNGLNDYGYNVYSPTEDSIVYGSDKILHGEYYTVKNIYAE